VNSLQRLWTHSILVRVAVVLAAVTLLALAVMTAAWIFTQQSMGKGSAINVAGSLRMQSYALAVAVASPGGDTPARAEAIRAAAAEFERRLNSPALRASVPAVADDPVALVYASIERRFAGEVRPLALAAIDLPRAQDKFLASIPEFVQQVDGFVRQLDLQLESRMTRLRWALMAVFAVVLLLGASVLWLLNEQVVRPLRHLVRAAREVRAGGFKVRAHDTGPDEIGQLGQAFNYMVEDLARLYGSLERQVAEKTADLERKNRSLGLLYETTRLLSGRSVDGSALSKVLNHVEQALGAEGGIICARHGTSGRGFPIAISERGLPEACTEQACHNCNGGAVLQWRSEAGEGGPRRVVSIPLVDSGTVHGVMPLMLPPGKGLEPWQIELAETVGRHVGSALGAAARHEEQNRLALLEERSAIARELHDSIAQSLAYTKIQLMRLASLLEQESDRAQAQAVVGEVRDGVSDAYRQLRELLTTFRLKVGGQGLDALISNTVAEFQTRTGLAVALDNRLMGFELSANEQIHLLQIVREALTNIEKHAHARHVAVNLDRSADGRVLVTIDDDGVGMPVIPERQHHFGLSIMRDRAATLRGEIEIGRRATGGTHVALSFRAASAFASADASTSIERNPA
jgi:two-component system nitrate/nitrite sensor histidine kinase NarX